MLFLNLSALALKMVVWVPGIYNPNIPPLRLRRKEGEINWLAKILLQTKGVYVFSVGLVDQSNDALIASGRDHFRAAKW